MAAPPSPGTAASEQERLVALIPVLTWDPFLSNLLRRSLAGRDSLGLSLEGCEPIGPLASKLCTFTPGFGLLLPPPPPEIPGVGRSIRSRCHSSVTAPNSPPPGWAWRKGRSSTPSRDGIVSPRSRRACHPGLMRDRSPLRVHDGVRDPTLTRGPRAQETVWGRALRTAIWGNNDPEWTTGDDAGNGIHPSSRKTAPNAPTGGL